MAIQITEDAMSLETGNRVVANRRFSAGEYDLITPPDRRMPAGLGPVLVFEEDEGWTLVVPRAQVRQRA